MGLRVRRVISRSNRGRRGALPARRDDEAYPRYVEENQRSRMGCIGVRIHLVVLKRALTSRHLVLAALATLLLLVACSTPSTSTTTDIPGDTTPLSDVVAFADYGNPLPELPLGGKEVWGAPDDVVESPPDVVPAEAFADVMEETASNPTSDIADDAGAPTVQTPFQLTTAGGDYLVSPNFRLQVFVAPARPVGHAASPGYRARLGPASFWRKE